MGTQMLSGRFRFGSDSHHLKFMRWFFKVMVGGGAISINGTWQMVKRFSSMSTSPFSRGWSGIRHADTWKWALCPLFPTSACVVSRISPLRFQPQCLLYQYHQPKGMTWSWNFHGNSGFHTTDVVGKSLIDTEHFQPPWTSNGSVATRQAMW